MRNSRDMSKLPKWAQEYISVLEMQKNEADAKLASLYFGDKTDTTWRDGLSERPLPPGSLVRFHFGNLSYVDCRLADYKGAKYLDVRGLNRVTIRPVAANCFEVHLEG